MHSGYSELVRELYTSHQDFQLLVMARLRNCAANDGIGRILFNGARWLAGLWISDERSTRRIGCILGYVRQFEGLAICPVAVPIKTVKINRTIRNDLV